MNAEKAKEKYVRVSELSRITVTLKKDAGK
jgi:hypothetical protein